MPRPTRDDPLYCPGSDDAEGWTTRGSFNGAFTETWWICPKCIRVLKVAGEHRVRSRTTASLDKTRDILAGITPDEIARGTSSGAAPTRENE